MDDLYIKKANLCMDIFVFNMNFYIVSLTSQASAGEEEL